MRLRTRNLDAITNLPIQTHRLVRIGRHMYDIHSVAHICMDDTPLDPMTRVRMSDSDVDALRGACHRIGLVPKRRTYSRAEDGGEEHHLDTLLSDSIYTNIEHGMAIDTHTANKIAVLLRKVYVRDSIHGKQLLDVVMRKIKNMHHIYQWTHADAYDEMLSTIATFVTMSLDPV
jgi:hypothetical protein